MPHCSHIFSFVLRHRTVTISVANSYAFFVALHQNFRNNADIAFWRVENSFGSFLPANPNSTNLIGKAYELRHVLFRNSDTFIEDSKSSRVQTTINDDGSRLERAELLTSGRLFEAVANFKLIWWNQGTSFRKKLSIWRPVVSPGMVFLGDIAVQGYISYFTPWCSIFNNFLLYRFLQLLLECSYEKPNSAVVLHDPGDESFLKAPQDFQLIGRIKKQKGAESITFWLPIPPPGFVALGCVASRGSPKTDDIGSLRCIRSDMVAGDQFADESIWDTSETRMSEHFSLWSIGNDLGTFLVRNGYRKPPRRFALKLAGSTVSSGSDNTVIDAEIKTISAAVFDDYGGLVRFSANLNFIILCQRWC